MKRIRIIPRLDVKGPNVVKGICLEGLRIVGKPADLAKKYYDQGADEILYIDIVASLYERNNLLGVVKETVSHGIFIPMTVCGGIRSIEDIKTLLRAGADKVAMNTAITKNPKLITEAANMFGSQCIVGSIEAKYKGGNKWEAYIDNGRERTGLDVIKWAKEIVKLGVGELLITSVDRDGTKKGYDLKLIEAISKEVTVPVIACSGAGNKEDIYNCINKTNCDAVSFGTILHYNETSIDSIKTELSKKGIVIREKEKLNENRHNKNKKTVSVIDCNVGNIKSVIDTLKFLGNPVRLINTPEEVLNSELLILPGDGAFGYAMQELRQKGLIESIKKYVKTGKPLLGICLGMQLLMTKSDEFGTHNGLNLIKGTVLPLKPNKDENNKRYKVPHMGWDALITKNKINEGYDLMKGTPENALVYFVHSFYISPRNKSNSLANTM